MKLGDASKVYVGVTAVSKIYVGTSKVWPLVFDPLSLGGLVMWFDASKLTGADGSSVTAWSNLGSGPALSVFNDGSGGADVTLKKNFKNGLSIARFSANGGRARATSTGIVTDYTLVYLVSAWGTNHGRALGAIYPSSNFLCGFATGAYDCCLDLPYGWVTAGIAWGAYPIPTPFKMYGLDSTTGGNTHFFVDGVLTASAPVGAGFASTLCLSGYDATAPYETSDFDLAEVLIYNKKLSDADRQSVEAYLKGKWGLP
jgi:hypothetical protein